jgi:hypothetical protein
MGNASSRTLLLKFEGHKKWKRAQGLKKEEPSLSTHTHTLMGLCAFLSSLSLGSFICKMGIEIPRAPQEHFVKYKVLCKC